MGFNSGFKGLTRVNLKITYFNLHGMYRKQRIEMENPQDKT